LILARHIGAVFLLWPLAALGELSTDKVVGPGFQVQPVYDGSSSQWTQPVPLVRYLGEHWFIRSTLDILEGGVRFEIAPGLHAGLQIAYEPNRQPSRAPFLANHHLAGIDPGASAGLHLEWDHWFGPMPVSLLLRSRSRFSPDMGSQADARISAGILQLGPLAAGVFFQDTWASEKSASLLYGITPLQSVVTGLPMYSPGSGWLYESYGLQWSFDLAAHWQAMGAFEAHRLDGIGASSPLTERATNVYLSAGLVYRF
jgi:outer membrane scaffolding protein for murein synthesis (MipA/OmpV family)